MINNTETLITREPQAEQGFLSDIAFSEERLKKHKKTAFLMLTVLVFLFCVYKFLLPQFIKPESVENILQSSLNSGYSLKLKNLDTDLSWDFNLVLDSDELSLKQGSKNLLYSTKTNIKVPIIMLLLHRFDNSQLYSDRLEANLERDINGKLNIQKAFKIKTQAPKVPKFRIAIKDYRISFSDKGALPIIFDGYNLDLGNLKQYRLKTFGSITLPDKSVTILNVNFISKKPISRGKFTLKGNVDNLDLSKFSGYISEICPFITSIRGCVNGDFDINAYGREKITDNLKISLNTNNLYISTQKYPNFLQIPDDTQIVAKGKYYNHKINFKKFRIVSKDYNIDLTGQIKDTDKFVKRLNIRVKTTNSQAAKLMGLVPKNLDIRHDGVNKAIRYKMDGIITCDLKIKGKSSAPKYWGHLKISNLAMGRDIFKSKSYVNILYNKRRLKINAFLVDTKDGIIRIQGSSKMGRKPNLALSVISDDRFYLSETRNNLIALSGVLGFTSGILPDTELDGFAKINVALNGAGKETKVRGNIQVLNTKVKYKKFSEVIYVPYASLNFEQRDILLKNLISYVKGCKTVLNGVASLDNDVDLVISSDDFSSPVAMSILKNSIMFSKISKMMNDIDAFTGKVAFKIKVVGNTQKNIHPSGLISLKSAGILFKGLALPINNMFGDITFDNTYYKAPHLRGEALGSSITFSGVIKDGKIDAKILAPNVDTNLAVLSIKNSPNLLNIAKSLDSVQKVYGRLDSILEFKGELDSAFFNKIECVFKKSEFYLKGYPAPLKLSAGGFSADKNQLVVDRILFTLLNSKMQLEGKINHLSTIPSNDLKLTVFNIDNASISALKSASVSKSVRDFASNIKDFTGNASGVIYIRDRLSGNIKLNNLGFIYTPASLPVKIKSGTLFINDNNISLSNANILLAGSLFKLNSSFDNKKVFVADLSGNLSPYDVDNYLNKLVPYPINLKQTAPVKLRYQKDKNGWKVLTGLMLQPGNVISYKGVSVGDAANAYLLGGEVASNNSILSFNNLGINQFPNTILANINMANPVLPKNFMEISGRVNLKTFEQNLRVYTREYMDINLLNEVLSKKLNSRLFYGGMFRGDAILQGKLDAPVIRGFMEVKGAMLPAFDMKIPYLNIVFAKDNIYFKNGVFQVANSEFNFDAVADNIIQTPYVFRDMNITASSINIDEIAKVLRRDNPSLSGILPVLTVKNGTLKTDKLVVNNLIADNAFSEFSFSPTWILSLDKFSFDTAGGSVSGVSSFDFTSFENKTHMKFKNLKANAVATTLLQMPNELYGLLNGEADFETKGISRSDIIKSSNGHIKFQIVSGRLVRLGSMEYLLRAAEVVKSGITGLSLNSICTLLSPQKTGYFDTINVDFKVKDGVLFTDNLISRGKKLSIYLAGNFDMTTNYSDFTILGKVSKSVVPVLGPVGNISISKIVNHIPGIKDSDSNTSVLSKLPVLDFNDKGFRRFIVNIEGDLYDQKSVKNFKWID